jgi:hypothetical protein
LNVTLVDASRNQKVKQTFKLLLPKLKGVKITVSPIFYAFKFFFKISLRKFILWSAK